MNMVLITGGTGLVGIKLAEKLHQKGYRVGILSRKKTSFNDSIDHFYWNPAEDQIDPEALKSADHIIHLAGAGIIDKKWSSKRKQIIIDSRVRTAEFLLKKIKEYNTQIKTYISASGVGYYGAITSERIYCEKDSPNNDYVSDVCVRWEKSANQFSNLGIRTVIFRIGVVLSKDGGALSKMKPPIKYGLGAAIGTGKQYMPWIHIDDLCEMFIKAIQDDRLQGVYNSASPDHQTNESINRLLCEVMEKPLWLPNIPSLLIKLLFGERSVLILNGSRVSSEKIENTGFVFLYRDLKSALMDLIKK